MMRARFVVGLLFAISALSGCARNETAELVAPPPPPPESTPSPPPSTGSTWLDVNQIQGGAPSQQASEVIANPSGGGAPSAQPNRFVLLTPMSQIGTSAMSAYIPGGSYTRLQVTSHNGGLDAPSDSDPEIYPYAKRSPIERFFVGTRHSETLTLKAAAGAFTATVPLVTVTHDSTRSGGEQFDRTIRHEARNFPIFLVRPGANGDVASITFDFKGNDSVESSVAGSALTAVVTATKLIAAPPAVLTSLSAAGNKDVATAIDGAINKLFATSLVEEQILDQPIRTWNGVTVSLSVPRRQGGWNDRKTVPADDSPIEHFRDIDLVQIGTWTVTFEEPHASAFASAIINCGANVHTDDACAVPIAAAGRLAKQEAEAHLGDILSFPLIDDAGSVPGDVGTIGSYLRQLTWWATDLKTLDPANADASHFCREIKDAVTGIGFNTLDASLVLEAVKGSSMVSSGEAQAMRNAKAAADCAI